MVNNYISFIEEKIFESLIKESILYYSPKFREALLTISNTTGDSISKKLIEIEGTDIDPDVTYVDISDESNSLSFSTMRDVKQTIYAQYRDKIKIDSVSNIRQADNIWKSNIIKSRNLIRIGRFVNKLFPNKYSDKEIEEFVNQVKSCIKNDEERILIVSGEKIAYWYDRKNYESPYNGQLGNSCMAGMDSSTFTLYTNNPDSCQMIILIENNKLKARALLWKVEGEILHSKAKTKIQNKIRKIKSKISNLIGVTRSNKIEFSYFVDRIYSSLDSDTIKIRKYAESQGWAYKTYSNYSDHKDVTYKNSIIISDMRVNLIPANHAKYPFMDTFRKYDPESGILYNNDIPSRTCIRLGSTGGGYDRY